MSCKTSCTKDCDKNCKVYCKAALNDKSTHRLEAQKEKMKDLEKQIEVAIARATDNKEWKQAYDHKTPEHKTEQKTEHRYYFAPQGGRKRLSKRKRTRMRKLKKHKTRVGGLLEWTGLFTSSPDLVDCVKVCQTDCHTGCDKICDNAVDNISKERREAVMKNDAEIKRLTKTLDALRH